MIFLYQCHFGKKALKITVYILNKVPIKVVAKVPNELWTGNKSIIRHMHIWECLAEARPYMSQGKLDSTI